VQCNCGGAIISNVIGFELADRSFFRTPGFVCLKCNTTWIGDQATTELQAADQAARDFVHNPAKAPKSATATPEPTLDPWEGVIEAIADRLMEDGQELDTEHPRPPMSNDQDRAFEAIHGTNPTPELKRAADSRRNRAMKRLGEKRSNQS
jgi:hypothetical protein